MKVWILTDKNGNEIVRGRKRDVKVSMTTASTALTKTSTEVFF